MEFFQCNVCFYEYSEEIRVPKVLECGHSLCDQCLIFILKSQKSCPKCRATLSKDIEEYPTNFELLGLSKSSKEKGNFLDACTLKTMKNELLSKKTILEKQISERDAMICSIESNKSSMQKLISFTKIMFEADEIKDFVPDIENSFEKVNTYLNCSWENNDMLRLKDYDNSVQFLREIARRLQFGKRIYAGKRIGERDLGEWRCGEITFSENQLHIHCLSSVFEPNASLVLLKEMKDCISRRENILPFIEVGSHKLWFRLSDDPSIATLQCIKFFTGEEGRTVKGLDLEVAKHESQNLNSCVVNIPTKEPLRGFEDALYRDKWCEVKKDEVTLHCAFNRVSIYKWPKDEDGLNLVGKLHENCQIDFEKIKWENSVTDCGISLQFHIVTDM